MGMIRLTGGSSFSSQPQEQGAWSRELGVKGNGESTAVVGLACLADGRGCRGLRPPRKRSPPDRRGSINRHWTGGGRLEGRGGAGRVGVERIESNTQNRETRDWLATKKHDETQKRFSLGSSASLCHFVATSSANCFARLKPAHQRRQLRFWDVSCLSAPVNYGFGA